MCSRLFWGFQWIPQFPAKRDPQKRVIERYTPFDYLRSSGRTSMRNPGDPKRHEETLPYLSIGGFRDSLIGSIPNQGVPESPNTQIWQVFLKWRNSSLLTGGMPQYTGRGVSFAISPHPRSRLQLDGDAEREVAPDGARSAGRRVKRHRGRPETKKVNMQI